ncbi:hypothetical protein [Microbacterium album]|uniref:Uncharacterized protein n=1 Tax=Microbacterium album TaxID=2053191 RepID=A0A917IGA0_9MICO|nr:hypothetical protein [Microbacterium album]GGH47467.1 hypothetical protein GCM10010921_24220 [Microbacterium album]
MNDAMTRFVEAVSRLPVYRGLSWRAADFALTTPLTTEMPIPTSRDVRVATENFRVAGAHLFVTTGAREIGPLAANPAEQEVVLLPGARLVPVSALHEVEGVKVQVVLEQPPANEPLPEYPDDEGIGTLIRDARSRADVAVTSPGRFGA